MAATMRANIGGKELLFGVRVCMRKLMSAEQQTGASDARKPLSRASSDHDNHDDGDDD